MQVKLPTVCFMNISEKAELTASISHTGKSATLSLSKLATDKYYSEF